jgi:hypothetical protein
MSHRHFVWLISYADLRFLKIFYGFNNAMCVRLIHVFFCGLMLTITESIHGFFIRRSKAYPLVDTYVCGEFFPLFCTHAYLSVVILAIEILRHFVSLNAGFV